MNAALAKRVKEAAAYYGYTGPIEPGMIHLLAEEGFSATEYDDDVGVATSGVGQTGENEGKNFFTETYPKYVSRTAEKVRGYHDMPENVQNALLSAVYRGDLGPKAAALLNKGEYAAASEEYLNHEGFKKRQKKDPEDGVVARMKRNAEAMKSLVTK